MHSQAVMAGRSSSGSLARAVIAGFIALGVSTVSLVIASGIVGSIGEVYRGSNLVVDWMYELTHNPVVELGRGRLFASLAVHLTVGMFLAIIYGMLFEPRLQQYPGWLAGVLFSFLPFFLSVVVFLPLTGGGLFGSALNAGPLPVLGNLILHLIFGATLGAGYSAGADQSESAADTAIERAQQSATMGRAENSAARGIVIGVIAGGVGGAVLGAILPSSSIERLIGSWPVAMGVAGALAGGAVGALIGSMAGLTAPGASDVVEEGPTTGQPIAAALLPLGVVLFVAFLIVSIGSGLLTVGDTQVFGKDDGYNRAILLGLSVLTVICAGAVLFDRVGRKPPGSGQHDA